MRKNGLCIKVLLVVVFIIGVVFWSMPEMATASNASSSTSEVKVFNWRMASTWADGTFLIEAPKLFAELVSKMSQGRLNIKVYPVGALAPANQVLDIVSTGSVEAGDDWPSYWSGKNTAFDLLGSQVAGLIQWDYLLWFYEGGGMSLYNEIYGKYNCIYLPYAITGMESGIRSNKPINSLDDLKGPKSPPKH